MPDKKKPSAATAVRRRATGHTSVIGRRKHSSRMWLERQLNDPYVAAAQEAGYRSRAAFKLIQIDEKFNLMRSGMTVVDLGAAPGGWSQVAAARVGATKFGSRGKVVALDLLPMDDLAGVYSLTMDFMADGAEQQLREAMGGQADVVLSDMAPSTTGHAATDHLRIMALADTASLFATSVLAPSGAFVCKLFQGGGERSFLDALKQHFKIVRQFKPAASRKESSETYLVASGFGKHS